MKKGNKIIIRDYKKPDAQSLADIYFYTIHNVNQKDYTNDQLNAWAPSRCLTETGWESKWDKLKPICRQTLIWKLDRLGRNLKNLITIVNDLNDRKIHRRTAYF